MAEVGEKDSNAESKEEFKGLGTGQVSVKATPETMKMRIPRTSMLALCATISLFVLII